MERMVSARWNKAERGELVTIPPAGYDLDELGQLAMTSDEAAAHAIRTAFAKLDELGSARQVLLWWQGQGLKYPVRRMELHTHPVVWLAPSYAMILRTLHNPIYAGAYVFGKSETVRRLDAMIEADTITANDFRSFFRNHERIRAVFFNGAKAESLYRQYVVPTVDTACVSYLRLPSTSPAHASLPFDKKLGAWRIALRP